MSASRERKKRIAQTQEPMTRQPKQKKKLSEGWIFAIVMLSVIAVVIGGVLGFRLWQQNRTVLTVGEHKVSAKEFNYFYNSIANNYFTYASYFSVDTTIPLDETPVSEENMSLLSMVADTSYLEAHQPTDGVYDVTVAQLLAATAKAQAIQYYTIYDTASAAGYALDAEELAGIDAELEALKTQGKEYRGWSLNRTIRETFGDGCNAKSYREYLILLHTAEHYIDTIEYTEEEITTRYNESVEDFDIATYYLYSTSAEELKTAAEEQTKADVVEEELTGETTDDTTGEATDDTTDNTTGEATDDTTGETTEVDYEAEAKAAAEEMEKNFDAAEAALHADQVRSSVESAVSEEAADWLFDTAAVGSTKLFAVEGTYYVLKLVDKSDYELSNIRTIYISNDVEGTELAEGELSSAERVEAVAAALAADSSVESFETLTSQYGDPDRSDNTLEDQTRASIQSSVSDEAALWVTEDKPTAGSWKQFSVKDATVFVMVEESGESYRKLSVNSKLVSEWLEEATTAAEAVCGYNEKAAMGANVGLFSSASN